MWSLLFIIGFEINLREIIRQKRFIVETTFLVVLLEASFGSLFIHFVFGTEWVIAILVGIAFATVGETVLVPILDEFQMTRTKLGQTILGVAVFDDVFEISVLFIVLSLIGNTLVGWLEMSPLLVLMLGIGIGAFTRNNEKARSGVKFVGFIVFAPFFFTWVGSRVSIAYLVMFPYLVFAKVALTKSLKIVGAYLIGRNRIGKIKSVILGCCLSVKFSASVVIFTILFDNGFIGLPLYSVLISSKIVYKFLVPFVLSYLVPKVTLEEMIE
jgi:Kef-type K+ transport system membrane component KefB